MNTEQFISNGKNLVQQGRFDAAQEEFKQAIVHNPRSVEARIWFARMALIKRDRTTAKQQIEKALGIDAKHPEAIAMKGTIAMTAGKFNDAVTLLEQAKALDPDLQMVYYNLARCYRKLNKLQQGEEAARKAIELDPANFQAHGELSNILFRTGRTSEAIRQMIEAIRINPLFLKGYLALGEVYKFAGKGDLAIRLYRNGLKHNPAAHVLRHHLCGLYALKGDFKQAYWHAARLAVTRNHFGDYLRLGNYALILGLFEKAEKAFKKAIELQPDNWQAHYNLGELYSAAKLVSEAKSEYEAAIARDGKSAKPHNGLGLLVLMQQNKPAQAKMHFTSAIERAPKSPVPILNLALAYSASNEFADALKFAEQAKQLSRPGSPQFQQAEKLIATLS